MYVQSRSTYQNVCTMEVDVSECMYNGRWQHSVVLCDAVEKMKEDKHRAANSSTPLGCQAGIKTSQESDSEKQGIRTQSGSRMRLRKRKLNVSPLHKIRQRRLLLVVVKLIGLNSM